MIDTCMKEGYKQVWIKVSTYDKLKELSKNSGKSIVRLIEEFVDGVSETKGFDKEIVKEIVDEVFSEKMKELESMLYNIVKKALSETTKPQERKKSFIEAVREAFLGERKPIILKKVPIQISKGNIFVEDVTELDIDLSKFKARVVEEPNERGEIVGLSIVPDIGFEDMSLEEWFDEYGINLIKELMAKYSKP